MEKQEVYFEVKGQGDPIVFLHGIGGSHTMFQPQVEFFSRSFQTITVDLMGSGRSPSLNCKPSEWLDIHSKSILDICNKLEIETFTLVGLSYGGIVAQHLAITHPQLVKKLILVDTYARTIPRNVRDWFLFLFGSFIALSVWFPTNWMLPLFRRYKRWDIAYKEMVNIIKNRRAKEVTSQMYGCVGLNNLPKLSNLEIPVLGIVGDAEPLITEKMEELIDTIPNGALHIIEDAFDPTNLCQPTLFNSVMNDFVQQ